MGDSIVLVKRVAEGTKEFMFRRGAVNQLMRERRYLKKDFEANKERYIWICNTIRALAGTMYFPYKPRKVIPPVVPPPAPVAPAPEVLNKKMKKELSKIRHKEKQTKLF